MNAIKEFQAAGLNHFETVYAPGDAKRVERLFEILDLHIDTLGPEANPFIMGFKDATAKADVSVYIAASQVLPEQWEFDQRLKRKLAEGDLSESFETFSKARFKSPYFTTHAGMQFEELDDWETIVARLGKIEQVAPELAGRVVLKQVFRPGGEGSLSEITHQAFLWTDLLACGSLAWGLMIELQHFDLVAYRASLSDQATA